MQKKVSEMTQAELLAHADKLERQQEKRRAYNATRVQNLTDEQRELRYQASKRRRERDKEILAEAQRIRDEQDAAARLAPRSAPAARPQTGRTAKAS